MKYYVASKLQQSSAVVTNLHTVHVISLQYIACESQFNAANLHARSYEMVFCVNAKGILPYKFQATGQLNGIALCNYTEVF